MNLRTRLAKALFPDVFEAASQRVATAPVSVQVDDGPGYQALTQGPTDRPWADRAQDLEDALEAYRKNFMVRRLVALHRSYVVGAGITFSSRIPEVDAFIRLFWHHPQNRMALRLVPRSTHRQQIRARIDFQR